MRIRTRSVMKLLYGKLNRKECDVICYYLNNIVRYPLNSRKQEVLCWLESTLHSGQLLGIDDIKNVWNNDGREWYSAGCKYKKEAFVDVSPKKMLARSFDTVRDILAYRGVVDITEYGYDKRMDMLLDVFKLSPQSRELLRYMVYWQQLPMMGSLHTHIFLNSLHVDMRRNDILSALTGLPRTEIQKILNCDSELFRNGILSRTTDETEFFFSNSFERMVCFNPATEAQVRKWVFGTCASAKLTRGNFSYITGQYDHIRLLLENAVKKRARGVNILIYGQPGTGKTEMCKSIARDIGARLYIPLDNPNGNKDNRVSTLALTQSLLRKQCDSIILFDEAEDAFTRDIFKGDDKTRYTKLYFNKMLEENEVPVIWVSNNIASMDCAYIRRFKYALELKKPDTAAKEQIWKNICAKHKVKLDREKIAEYARSYDIAPSFIDTAVEAAKLTESAAVIETTIASLQKASNGTAPVKKRDDAAEFDPQLLNTDLDLINLVDKLVQKDRQKFSFCLYGEPGTGKSAFARYLAGKLGLKVEQKRASELISCWVGESEKNIARAFEEARDGGAVLVFDEADSFLRSRKMAQNSWEAMLVNEMLTQMENHPYPFICTTNLMRDLDEASLRRFMFKVKYEFMKPAQVRMAFSRFFGVNISNKISLSHLTHLTPGDFAVVKGKSDLLDINCGTELVKMLESEQSAKGVKTAKMGFA